MFFGGRSYPNHTVYLNKTGSLKVDEMKILYYINDHVIGPTSWWLWFCGLFQLFYGSKIKKYNVKNNRPHMCPVFSPAACSNSQASSSQAQQFLEALSSYPPHRTHAWVSSAWNTQSSLFPHLISIQLSDLTEMVPFHKGLLLSIPHEMFSSFFIFYLFYFFF
jgi:hypothetical protein